MSDDDESPELRMRMHDPRVADARGHMLDLSGVSEEELGGIVRVMDAMFRWRQAEQRVSEASRGYMRLGVTDMRALRFAMFAADQGRIVTARDIAEHLSISSASTSKLLDRLEHGGHIRRAPHPTDRRAISIIVDETTRTVAEKTVGFEHARRFRVAAALTPAEREVVIRFLDALSNTSEDRWAESAQAEDLSAS